MATASANKSAAGDPFDRELPWLRAPLIDALQRQRGHALLVQGQPGVGQLEFALGLAQAWLCEAPAAEREAGVLACGRCSACHLWRSRSHPDALILVPAALADAMGWQADADEGGTAEGEGKARAKLSAEIKVDAVRQAVAFSQQTSSRGGVKVVLVYPAEQMNAVSANTLLKTLEEPPGAARFVLASGHSDRLLPTVRSRCQVVGLGLPESGSARGWLAEQGVEDPDVLLAACGGQVLAALDLQAQGIDAGVWAQVPRLVAAGTPGLLAAWPVPRVVQALLKLCNDALRVACGREPLYFPAAVVPRTGDVQRLTAWAAELRKFMRHAEHPLNAPLQIEALVQRGRAALRVSQ